MDYLSLAVAVEHRHPVLPLEFADVLGDASPLIQQIEQPLVDLVNLSAVLPKLCHVPFPLEFLSEHLRQKTKAATL